MKKLLSLCVSLFLILTLSACDSFSALGKKKEVTLEDCIVGQWMHVDTVYYEFSEDGKVMNFHENYFENKGGSGTRDYYTYGTYEIIDDNTIVIKYTKQKEVTTPNGKKSTSTERKVNASDTLTFSIVEEIPVLVIEKTSLDENSTYRNFHSPFKKTDKE